MTDTEGLAPFARFLGRDPPRRTGLRAWIDASYRRPETDCLPPLIADATFDADTKAGIRALASRIVTGMRTNHRPGGVEALVHEYALSTQEGVALMCLAEALLRIPDNPTRDALIADALAGANWQSHLGAGRPLFVNAATWGLMVAGTLASSVDEEGLARSLTRLLARSGAPVIRAAMTVAMRTMGEQFVAGETIEEALRNARRLERRGYRHSYDMLGEAAMTAADAERYFERYQAAVRAVGEAAGGRGVIEGPGVSIKLSALHPRYSRTQYDRVTSELLPRVIDLARLARSYDIGLSIDAEEADRVDLSLDILDALCAEPSLEGWHGIGIAVQAYSRRCPSVIDFIIDLARRSGHRIMVRLVKGAYWDSEIKRAQVDGQDDFSVYTRKPHSDVAFIACARRLLAAGEIVYPQFATHNAQAVATIQLLTGGDAAGRYEFQCLHGMGETLYDQVIGADRLGRPCRIYAPVGSHETLLAYLVRRLLENGANSSFVNRFADAAVPLDALVADPAELAGATIPAGRPNPAIRAPADLFDERRNSGGLDLSSEPLLVALAGELRTSATAQWSATPQLTGVTQESGGARPIRNPADPDDIVGQVVETDPGAVEPAVAAAAAAAPGWARVPVADRAALLLRTAEAMEARRAALAGLIVREAGRTIGNALAEIREAVDFLRYYAAQALRLPDAAPLGPVACISPWNFPLAIFTGQVAAALVAGNPVLAKPAEQTPLIALQAVDLLHEAGIPREVLQLLPGDGAIGAALIADNRICGVLFTGSIDVGRHIARTLAGRTRPDGRPVPFVAETGGVNAMIVDSSALTEQVVADVLSSAFDSAGQRCSSLRMLYLQQDIAERTLTMLKGAMAELTVGNPDRLATDIGPLISAEARADVLRHIEAMRARRNPVHQAPIGDGTAKGSFVAPTLIELSRAADLDREVFGPVLHVARFHRDGLDAIVDAINATGYGLTFGLHTRIGATIERVTSRIRAGNIYVNRNQIGAVVGMQPFGGSGLSGTGPKAGGPLYLRKLVDAPLTTVPEPTDLAGPVGERNTYSVAPRGEVLALASTASGMRRQLDAIASAGATALIPSGSAAAGFAAGLAAQRTDFRIVDPEDIRPTAVLVEGNPETVIAAGRDAADRNGPIVPLQALADDAAAYSLQDLVVERCISINTAAMGGDPGLMSLGAGEAAAEDTGAPAQHTLG